MEQDALVESLLGLSDDAVAAWIVERCVHFDVETFKAIKARAEEMSANGDLDGALRLLDRGALAAESANIPLGTGLMWRGRANALERHERYEESLNATYEAVKLYQEHGTEFDIAVARTIEIYALGALERFEEAIELAEWIRSRFAREDSEWARLGLANVAANLGAVYIQAWRLEPALQELETAAQLYRELDMPDKVPWVLHDMGLVASCMDRLDLARQYYEQAHTGFVEADLVAQVVKVQFNMAEVCTRQADYEQALAHLSIARDILVPFPESPDHAFVDLFESRIRRELDQPTQAKDLLERALRVFEQLGRRIETALTLMEMGRLLGVAETPDKLSEGLSCLSQAEAHCQRLNLSALAAWIQLERGELGLRLGRTAEATACANQARTVFAEFGLPLRLAQADVLLADCCRCLQPVEARQLYESVLHAAGRDLPVLAVRCWHGLAKLAVDAGKLEEAEQSYTQALELVATVRKSLVGHSHQAGFLEDKQSLIDELLGMLHKLPGRGYSVLGWVEQFKACVLADMVASQPPDAGSSPELVRLLEQRERLRYKIDTQYSSLAVGGESPLTDVRQRGLPLAAHDECRARELSCVQQQIQTIEDQIARQRDETLDWRQTLAMDPRHIHRLLDEQTLLISYYTAGGRVYALTVTHLDGDVKVHSLNLGIDEIEDYWWQAYRLLARRTSDRMIPKIKTYLAYLWKSLVAPLGLDDRLRDMTRLLILPHRGLFNIPFAGLYDAESGLYLVERWTVQLAPSAAVLARCRQREQGALPPLLVGYPGLPGEAGYLHGVEKEVRSLAELLHDSATLFGEHATSHNVMKAAPKRSVLHMAGHAFYNPVHPLESGMPLAGGRWLRASDLYLHYGHLGGSTVVLSSCSAGRGRPTGGDVLGLTSAFLYAGAVGIISSLWRVDDAATAELMTSFYRELYRGADAAAALRLAQLELVRSEKYSHPYFWAPFGLSGDSRMVSPVS